MAGLERDDFLIVNGFRTDVVLFIIQIVQPVFESGFQLMDGVHLADQIPLGDPVFGIPRDM